MNATQQPPVHQLDSLSNQDTVHSYRNHTHQCCDGRTHCDGSKCPNGPVLNPMVGIPLAICTAGLSCAATGMYKGYRSHKARKALQQAHTKAAQNSRSGTEEQNLLTPNPVAAQREPLEKGDDSESKISVAPELDSTPVTSAPPSYSESDRSGGSMMELDGKAKQKPVFELE